MTFAKRKAVNPDNIEPEGSNRHNISVGQIMSSSEPTLAQLAEQEKHARVQRAQLEKKKATMTHKSLEESEDEQPPQVQHDELTATALKLKAFEREKANLNAQLATKQRAAT
ncbi:hypothetical protein PVAP13_4NG208111 [Panicum virgatum]|uniref:Uncharacterized protein n=1 Tax=Panicum virgatum TaxID=38727 RepID=A0A8T0T797_PANVG|nr:hypothetical protein PVAP13_4NG208111 [Panicum virgatum]